MHILGATTRGLQHRAAGTLRQDAFALGRRVTGETERTIAVVCDGVGSLGQSDMAAVLVSRRLADLGAEGTPWAEAFACANRELCELVQEILAEDGADRVRDGMATTVVAVAVHREADEWIGTVAWVGDSTLWHLRADAQWELITSVTDPDIDAEYHSSGVTPLPSADGKCSSLDFRLSGGRLFMMSDGVGNPLRWIPEVQETLAAWWMQPPDPFTFAAQVGFARKTHMDDRTVVGIWPAADQGREDPDNPDDLVSPSPIDSTDGEK